MLYMFRIYAFITIVVFGFAGFAILSLKVWDETRSYAHARLAMRRIATGTREDFANSRPNSRSHDAGLSRVA
jgi:hypothetical protein